MSHPLDEPEGHLVPGALSRLRVGAIRKKRIVRYLSYAVGEVVLIFIGITLAIAFENAGERRRLTRLEGDILRAIQRNLGANVVELDRNIDIDTTSLRFLEPVIDHFSQRLRWHDSLGTRLSTASRFSSPYFDYSAFESLKQLGLHLVSSSDLRDELVHLYEGTYVQLVNDQDRGHWLFFESVFIPVRNRELDFIDPIGTGPRSLRVRDYYAALDRGELVAALAEHRNRLVVGLERRRLARAETLHAIESIGQYLGQPRARSDG